jgi:hypothetical protein
LLAICGVALAPYVAQTFFGLTQAQLTSALLGVCLIALFYQVNSLREERPKLKKKFVNDLLYSEPIAVKHDPPKNLTPDGKETWGADKHDFECFWLFWYFGEAANRELELYRVRSMRLQELSDTEIRGDLAMESPAYGRRSDIFYNQTRIGSLQIKACSLRDEQDKPVFAHIALDRVPVTALPCQQVHWFLSTIAGLVTSDSRKRQGKTEYEFALSRIDYQLAETMWSTLNNYTLGEPTMSELEVTLSGTPDRYYQIEAHERTKRMQAQAEQNSTRQSA